MVFASNRGGAYDLYEKAANGSGNEQVLLQSADLKRPNSWSRDGRFILYWAGQNNGDLMVLPLAGDRKPFSFPSTLFDEQQGVFSPDGKWVAYHVIMATVSASRGPQIGDSYTLRYSMRRN